MTTDLLPRFEEAASIPEVTKQEEELFNLTNQLPSCNRILISWLIMHFDEVTANEKSNKINAQNLAMLLSPSLQMSHRLLVTLLCHCTNLFGETKLFPYVYFLLHFLFIKHIFNIRLLIFTKCLTPSW